MVYPYNMRLLCSLLHDIYFPCNLLYENTFISLVFFCKKFLSHFCNSTSINIYKIEYVWLIVDFYMFYYISFRTTTIFHLIAIFFLNFNILFLKSIPLLYLMLKKCRPLPLLSHLYLSLYFSHGCKALHLAYYFTKPHNQPNVQQNILY